LTSVSPASARPAAQTTTTIALGGLLTVDPKDDPDTQVAVRLAVDDLNAFFAASGSPYRVSLAVEATGLDPVVARQKVEALAPRVRGDGKQAIVPMWRADVWGDDISAATRAAFTDLGGSVFPGVRFDPDAADFSDALAALAAQVQLARAQYGDAVAIPFFGF